MDHAIAHQSTLITPDFSAHEARERLENPFTELADRRGRLLAAEETFHAGTGRGE